MPALPRPPARLLWTVELLAVQPTDQLLEIGCGPGLAVALVAARLTGGGTVTASDRSAAMVVRARAHNAAAIAAGRVRIAQQTLAEAAEAGGAYQKVFAVNVNAFWTDPAPSLAALARLVRPTGAVYLVYEPPGAERLHQLENALPTALLVAGFRVTDLQLRRSPRGGMLAVVACPPADEPSVR